MLTKLGQRGYSVQEEEAEYRTVEVDTDSDPDSDQGERGVMRVHFHGKWS